MAQHEDTRFHELNIHWCRQVRVEDPVACTVSKQHVRKRASRTHTYSATPSCAIIHAQAHAPVPHLCVFYTCDDNNDNRKDTVWFDSFRFQTFRKLIGSVRFGSEMYFSGVRRGSACVFRTRRGLVRFGSVRFRVRFRAVPELNDSVRFGRFGSVRFLIIS